MKENELITIEETLGSSSLPEGMLPHLLLGSMVLTSARKPNVWLNLVFENTDLIGKDGTVLKIPKMTQLGASTEPADNIEDDDFSGFQVADPTMTTVDIAVADLVYCSFKLSKILLEDNPSIDYVNTVLSNAKEAVLTKMNYDIRSVVQAAMGTETQTIDAFSYANVLLAREKLENSGWLIGDDSAVLVVSVKSKNALLTDKDFVPSERFTTAQVNKMVDGSVGLYADCYVVVDPDLTDVEGYIMATHGRLGPVVDVVYKRLINTATQEFAMVEKTQSAVTTRYKAAVVQPLGIVKITVSSSP